MNKPSGVLVNNIQVPTTIRMADTITKIRLYPKITSLTVKLPRSQEGEFTCTLFAPKTKRNSCCMIRDTPQVASNSCSVWFSERTTRSEEHTSELQSHLNLVCRLLLEKKKKKTLTDAEFRRQVVHFLVGEITDPHAQPRPGPRVRGAGCERQPERSHGRAALHQRLPHS